MNNYIIWNGQSSSTIDGLLICELPPITKPQERTRVTEIDGRDGDIVDRLGYESYSKKVKIGLHGNFNINEVIKYFTGTGNVTFSNEPDKYYKATIVKKIDYNRLIRYRTATVEFHVQPFKFKLNEAPIVEDLTESEATEIVVQTAGYEIAKPIIEITGTGDITITKNGHDVFTVSLDAEESETIILDSEELEATDTNGNLKNRKMTGDFLLLDPLENNTITWTGNLEAITIYPRSRWL